MKVAIILEAGAGELDRMEFETDDPGDVSEELEVFLNDKLIGPGDTIRIVDLGEAAA